MTPPGAVRLWVEVTDPAEIEDMRRLGVCEAFVVRSPERPFYGRPGDVLYVRLTEEDVAGPLQPLSYRIPLRAGVIVPASERGLVALRDLRRRGREHTAAEVRTLSEFLLIGAAGAEYALVAGAEAAVIAGQAGDRPPWVVTEVASVEEVAQAMQAGAGAVLISSRLLRQLVAGEAAPGAPRMSGTAPGPLRPEPEAPAAPRGAATRAELPSDTVAGLVERSAQRFGAGLALVHHARGQRLTYAQLRQKARAVGKGLLALGVQRGDRVALLARNIPEWPVIHFGSAYLGAILVTVNTSSTGEELQYILTQSGASLLLAQTPEMVEAFAGASAMGLPELSKTVSLGSVRIPGSLTLEELLDLGQQVSDRELDRAAAALAPGEVINIQYTSGTTGRGKGAMLTHRGMIMNARAVGANLRLTVNDRLCLPVPFFHCFGSVLGTLTAVSYGSALVVPADWFDAARTLEAVRAERCTVLHGVPTMFQAALAELKKGDDRPTTLRTGIVAGAPVSPVLMAEISEAMQIPKLIIAYGLTEASPVITMTPIEAPTTVRFNTIGIPLPEAEVKILDLESGDQAPPDTPGELCTRGPMVMKGYFNLPQDTSEAIDQEGWLRTGDLATVDAAGHYRIVGRLKDMIIRGGENIYPVEVEAVLERHPAVRQAAVAGIPSEYYGEDVGAWVIPHLGAAVSEQELRDFVGQHLASFKIPRQFRFVEQLPVTASGKVRKAELRLEDSVMEGGGAVGQPRAAPPSVGSRSTGAQPTQEQRAVRQSSGRQPAVLRHSEPQQIDSERRPPIAPLRNRLPLPLLGPKGQQANESRVGHSLGDQAAPGWSRPDQPAWSWGPDQQSADGRESALGTDIRRRGSRIKEWGIKGDIEEAIETTGEYPIMYRALGTDPQTGHPFNLYHDIRSQPDALAETFRHAEEVVRVAEEMAWRDIWGVLGIGSGTSQFVAQVVAAALSRFAGLPAWDVDSLAFRQYRPPFDFKKLAVIAYSGSGSTVDTVAAAKDATESGAFTVAFTSVDDSPVVKATNMRVLTAGGFDTGGSDTFHYTTRLASGILLALELGRKRRPDAYPYEALKGELFATARHMTEILDRIDARCRTIARNFHGVRSVLIVGGGANYGTAEEIALKFDEMAHIPAKGMSPGRHIHGALGLTDHEILTLLIAPPGICYDELESIAEVTKVLKTPSVAIVAENDDRIAKMTDYVLRLPVEDEVIFSVLAILPGQLIPYWCGVQLGLNPDTQRSNIPKHARVWNMLFPPGTH